MSTAIVNDLKRRIQALSVTDVPVLPWFLDVDGVLNVIGPRPAGPEDWPHYERGPVSSGDGLAFPFVWAPDLIDCMNLLAAGGHVSVRWLTTWEYDAPTCVAPVLGLRVGHWIAETDDMPYILTWWKLRAIRNHMFDDPGPFIWTEDEIKHHHEARQHVDMMPRDQALVIQPSPKKGLTPEHISLIVDFIERLRG